MIFLKDVEDTYIPDDLVNIQIDRIKNRKGEYINKYIIHVENDSYGLLSDRYVYVSSKEIKDKFTKAGYKLKSMKLTGPFLKMDIEDKAEKTFTIDDDDLQLISMLMDVDKKLIQSKTILNAYIINNYSGENKINVGNQLTILDNNRNELAHIPIPASNISNPHLSSIETTLGEYENKISSNLISKIKNIPIKDAENEFKKYVSEKFIEKMKDTLSGILDTKYNPFHMIIYLAYFANKKDNIASLKNQLKIITAVNSLLNL